MWVAYHTQRTITTLQETCRLTLCVRRCRNQQCPQYHCPYRPEEEGRWALPHGEFGLDVIALVGSLRYISHRSVPEIHQALCDRGIRIAERTVTHLLQRYEELVALHLAEKPRLSERFKERGQIVLAIDGLQPDVGHEVLWVLRDCLSGEVLLAQSLLSACEADLASLLSEVQQGVDVPICGVISDGQRSIRKAVQAVLPNIPHQLCHFHYLREAAKPVYEADKHAKNEDFIARIPARSTLRDVLCQRLSQLPVATWWRVVCEALLDRFGCSSDHRHRRGKTRISLVEQDQPRARGDSSALRSHRVAATQRALREPPG